MKIIKSDTTYETTGRAAQARLKKIVLVFNSCGSPSSSGFILSFLLWCWGSLSYSGTSPRPVSGQRGRGNGERCYARPRTSLRCIVWWSVHIHHRNITGHGVFFPWPYPGLSIAGASLFRVTLFYCDVDEYKSQSPISFSWNGLRFCCFSRDPMHFVVIVGLC